MAFAGVVIGLVGTLLVGSVASLFIAGVVSGVQSAERAHKTSMTEDVLVEAERIIEMHRAENGKLPGGIEGNKLLLDMSDAWDNSIRYDRIDDFTYLVRSAGADGEFDTDDDVTEGPGAAADSDSLTPEEPWTDENTWGD
jgi:hypothetical protein